MNELFHRAAAKVSRTIGSPLTFVIALLLVIGWTLGGILGGFTDSWLLAADTLCTLATFLIVFLIQNTQNRESRAIQLKLNELLKAISTARTDLVGLEQLTDKELDDLENDFRDLREDFIERHSRLVTKRIVQEKERRRSRKAP